MRKRILTLLLILIYCLTLYTASTAEPINACSYDFDLSFSLNADAFAEAEPEAVRGYTDLLNSVRFRGNLTLSLTSEALDLQVEIIPVSKPSSSIRFRLYGIPSHLMLSSHLLGNQTVAFNNAALLEFSVKTFQYLGFPLQYITLLFPYVYDQAFRNTLTIWNEFVAQTKDMKKIPSTVVSEYASRLEECFQKDRSLYYWAEAIGIASGYNEIIHDELNAVSYYILESLTGKNNIDLSCSDGMTVWSAGDRNIYTEYKSESSDGWHFDGTVTSWGNIPSVSFVQSLESDGTRSFSGEIHLFNTEIESDLYGLSFSSKGIPSHFPDDIRIHISVSQTGELLPSVDIQADIITDKDGAFQLNLFSPAAMKQDENAMLTINGSIKEVQPLSEPTYSYSDFAECFNIFSVNDITLPAFVNNITKPMILGLIDFLSEIPASAFQSVMNTLQDSGILNMLLID